MSYNPGTNTCNNVIPDALGNVCAWGKDGKKRRLSNRYGFSAHSCSCNRSKTGLVFYPYDIRHKNVVLVVCESCYGYQTGRGTRHQQLHDWYFRIYGTSKQFILVSGFAQEQDGNFKFNSSTFNETGPYSSGKRGLLPFEQRLIPHIVNWQLANFQVQLK